MADSTARKKEKGKQPFVSIIIPCYNTQDTLKEVLESIVGQDYPAFEIIAVDDGSVDDTVKIIQSFGKKITLIQREHKGASAARNAGIEKSKGDIILFQDADAKVFPNWVSGHVKEQKKGKKIVAGSVVPWKNGFVGMCDHYSTWYEYYPQKPAQENRYQISSTNLSLAREVIEKVGTFNTKLPRLEDVEYCLRVQKEGYSISFAPSIPMAHHDRQTWKSFLVHHYKYGYNAPFVRNREAGARFSWLIPQNQLVAFLMILPLGVLHTGFVILNWLPFHIEVILFTPFIFASKVAHAIGIYHGVRDKKKETRMKNKTK